jgi:hypothetical protein
LNESNVVTLNKCIKDRGKYKEPFTKESFLPLDKGLFMFVIGPVKRRGSKQRQQYRK